MTALVRQIELRNTYSRQDERQPTATRITSDPDHQIGGVVTTITVKTTTVTKTTTDRDRTTAVIAITITGQTTIMIGMKTIGMTDMIRGIHVI